jgi:hypothetical protein
LDCEKPSLEFYLIESGFKYKGKGNQTWSDYSIDPIGNRKAVQYRSGAEYQILTGLTLPDVHHLNT